MALFRKPEVVLLKDAESANAQIEELTKLEKEAGEPLKTEIAKQIALLTKGSHGEDDIMFQLNYSGMDMFVIRDLYLECDGLTAQIDYYIVTSKLNFIIECKNLYGNITINNKGDFIRCYKRGSKTVKEGIEAPITQNERHMLVLKNKRLEGKGKVKSHLFDKYFEDCNIPLVVLANSKTVLNDKYAPKEIKSKVIRADALVNEIKKRCNNSNAAKSNLKEMRERAEKILALHTNNTTDYVAKYRELVAQQKQEPEKTICPRCGAQLVKRNGKKGEFLGCSNFPKCWYTAQLDNKGE
ncbi:MAG: topoisomerase DNA-binding C4 zinc finger domain-containing protein [Eubacterium sp.]|nr:topoisomerase DNA-binding C4 zinc finger domain-containing protein [Eubacterium sp.]